jgi:hypothetical protein
MGWTCEKADTKCLNTAVKWVIYKDNIFNQRKVEFRNQKGGENMPVIRAESINFEDKVHLITAAVAAPQIEKSREQCAESNSHLSDSAFCYRVCGKLPEGKRPMAYRYFSRTAHQDEHMEWIECSHDGCEGYDHHFDEDTSTVCSSFKLWKKYGEHCNLMIEVSVV